MPYDDDNDLTIHSEISACLKQVDVSEIRSGGDGYEALPDGYYLCELAGPSEGGSWACRSKKTGNPMLKFAFRALDNGLTPKEDGSDGYDEIANTMGRLIFKNYVFNPNDGGSSATRFFEDLRKYQDPATKTTLLDDDSIKALQDKPEAIEDILNALVGLKLYVHLETREGRNGLPASQWAYVIAWDRAERLGLPMPNPALDEEELAKEDEIPF